jgi:hypothetical protein
MLLSRTLGDVFCDTVDSLDSHQTQSDVFLLPSPNNQALGCDNPARTKIDFRAVVAAILKGEEEEEDNHGVGKGESKV